jgi:lipoate-protein ligase B
MFWVCRLGKTEYEAAFQLQQQLRVARLQGKIPNLLLLTSHPPLFTLGKRDCREDLISPLETVKEEEIAVIQTNRGGRITYHGPGQVVGYFIADIRSLKLSVPAFVERVEELIIQTLARFNLQTHRDPEYPGVWKGDKKIAALGLHFDRGVSMHGFALNVNPNLEHYRHIIPCGIPDRKVSSVSVELKRTIDIFEVEHQIIEAVKKVFDSEIRQVQFADISNAQDSGTRG